MRNGGHGHGLAHSPAAQRLLSSKMFPATRRRFLARLAGESKHLAKIKSVWPELIAELGLPPNVEKALTSLNLEKLRGYLESGNFHSFKLALEQQGEDWANQGVPEECAASALGLLFETCLGELLSKGSKASEYALGLARLASLSQVLVAAGFAHRRAEHVDTLEKQLGIAEQRVRGLATSISEANEKERRRLARDLHDEIGHDLVVMKLYLELIIADYKAADDDVHKRLTEASGLATRAIEAVRRLAFDLGPGIFAEAGFLASIKSYVKRFSATTGVKATLRVISPYTTLEPRQELALYRVLQGALSNVIEHSGAETVAIVTSSDTHRIRVTIEDNGKGFNVARKLRQSRASFGLQAMRERIELLGGSFQIHSPATQIRGKRKGTRIEIVLPAGHADSKRTNSASH